MWTRLGAILLLVAVANANNATHGPKVLCYYDGSGSQLESECDEEAIRKFPDSVVRPSDPCREIN